MITKVIRKFRNKKPPLRFYSNTGMLNILGIETSCDDTGAAIINSCGTILGQSLISQSKLHVEAGGIIPQVAGDLHKLFLKNAVEETIKASKLDFKDLDAVAVTVTPGLIYPLTVGIEYAKSICELYNKPLIPIHHMEAHALTARLTEDVNYPFLTLLISGGHCILALVKSPTKFYRLGEALDHSPGQVFDLIARRAKLRNLKECRGLVGGAAIEKLALKGDPTAIRLVEGILFQKKNCHFSFSGIIAVAKHFIKKEEQDKDLPPDAVIPNIHDFCATIQWATVKHLCQRLEYAMIYADIKNLFSTKERCVVVSGGVASNKFVRGALKFVCDHYNFKIVSPPPEFCTDNGVMIAWNAIERLKENCSLIKPNELASVIPVAKNQLGEDISEEVEKILQNQTFSKVKLNQFLSQV